MPVWLFILVLVLLVVLANLVFWVAGLWCMGKLMRSPALVARRVVVLCALVVLLDYAVMGGLAIAGIQLRTTNPLPAALVLLAYVLASRVWVAGRVLRRRLPGAVLAAAGAMLVQVVLLFAMGTPVRRTLIDVFRIPTASMAPTLPEGGRFLVDRTLTPRRWDIMMYRAPEPELLYYAKRVVGMPGERVEVLRDRILIDGAEVPLPAELRGAEFLIRAPGASSAWTPPLNSPVTLGPDEYYVIGDNTQRSSDSRYSQQQFGPSRGPGLIPASAVAGVVRLIYHPSFRFIR